MTTREAIDASLEKHESDSGRGIGFHFEQAEGFELANCVHLTRDNCQFEETGGKAVSPGLQPDEEVGVVVRKLKLQRKNVFHRLSLPRWRQACVAYDVPCNCSPRASKRAHGCPDSWGCSRCWSHRTRRNDSLHRCRDSRFVPSDQSASRLRPSVAVMHRRTFCESRVSAPAPASRAASTLPRAPRGRSRCRAGSDASRGSTRWWARACP